MLFKKRTKNNYISDCREYLWIVLCWGWCSVVDLGYREQKSGELLEKEKGVVGGNGGWVADWVGCGNERRVESEGMKI